MPLRLFREFNFHTLWTFAWDWLRYDAPSGCSAIFLPVFYLRLLVVRKFGWIIGFVGRVVFGCILDTLVWNRL
jgi:hypothetical protein